ncbi:hypothetical protein [Leeuwenhoekiella sp.]|uniref:hypothetical protein n=2 Tax=Leeuwenhoekiella TaxID=283735 RepID=UPI000C6C1085|nr:hypothetical protein [Leeuwenhoekiella sp.]MAO42161.1 hypothetical protein [Leeuwenhoekiella sp.]|tara:strand:+ start:653 stop:1150 length:498 start_codon:yes stop_codon:yes gene_type:complete
MKTEHQENPATEHLAAQTILHRGVKVKVAAPFFLRWFGKRTIALKLTSPYEGTMYRVAAYYLSTGLKDHKLENTSTEEALALMSLHGKSISKAVACAILNGYWSGKLFTRLLAWYLRWHCKPRELFALTTALLIYGGTADFMSTTRSVRKMKLTTPNLGQNNQGS